MNLSGLLAAVAVDPTLAPAVRLLAVGSAQAARLDLTAPPGLRPFAAAVAAGAGRTVLAVTATGQEADDLAAGLRCLLPPESVTEFPAWETLPHERLSPRADTVGRRLAALRRLRHPVEGDAAAGPVSVLVAPVRAVLQPVVAGLGDLEPVSLRAGDDADLTDVVRRLVDIGYARTDLVAKRGDLAVRGGLVDVFPPTEEHPLRVEFWGDTVEEVRWFAVADQRSLETADRGLWAPPCRELLLTDTVRERAASLAADHPGLVDVLDAIAAGTAVEGMESLAPVLADRMVTVLDELPARSLVLVADPERVRTRAADLVATSREFLEASWAVAAAGGSAPLDLGAAAFRSVAEIRGQAAELGVPWWTVGPFGATSAEVSAGVSAAASPDHDGSDEAPVDSGSVGSDQRDLDDEPEPDGTALAATPTDSYRGDVPRALGDIRGWLREGYRVVVVTAGHGPAQRMAEVLSEAKLPARLVVDLTGPPARGVVTVTTGGLATGFVHPDLHLAVLTETDLAGRQGTHEPRRLPSRRRNVVDPLVLQPGDPVVHEQHGVGRFVGMVSRTVQGATREYLVLEYARGDRLFVPSDALSQVTRYVGGEAPSLHRLGGAEWKKAKGRARKAVKQIADELIRLYSARMASPGYAFGPDTPWQRELEDAFAYVETPDQLAAINEVKADMERTIPMDRVICGDVGYGKTEIAVRAAFKAAADGKQVAVLVPTTLLAQQHYQTFSERYAPFPVQVRMVSRFNSPKEQEAALAGAADGTVDVVIGTHRLLAPSTRFKELGLVVVDEEQRFGVEHKEFLKRMRTHVDVLTMSATPIPRTLEMAVTGIREMSTILTPPEERHPVLTFVGPYDDKQIGAAVRRELMRDGQVFYVHNRVESIDKVARRLGDMVPEARIAVAHGQMDEDTLEHIMARFWEREFDVLVCTTIVESGLDVSNANTLIVERADALGLSQLHQLRGRVGRGRERAYAYFLYPTERPLTETAHDRLATIAQHSDLGAGMQVAMKDLEIRGAGNLLGGEQSGHIAAVGFDLYVRLVGEAVAAYKGGPAELPEVKVELPVDAYVPHDYVPGERLRLEAYRRIADAVDNLDPAGGPDAATAALGEVRAELVDRYGPLPEPVENLLAVAEFRAQARRLGVQDVALQGRSIRFAPVRLRESQAVRLQRLYPGSVVKPPVHPGEDADGQVDRTVLVPRPTAPGLGRPPVANTELLDWCGRWLADVLGDPVRPAASPGGRDRSAPAAAKVRSA